MNSTWPTNRLEPASRESALVIGASGFLGRKVYAALRGRYDTTGTSRQGREGFVRLDVTKRTQVLRLFERMKCTICVHAAGHADPDYCETHRREAWDLNALGTRHVAEGCASNQVRLVYISTDYVFDGEKTGGHHEDDEPNPLQFYGRTKLAGERFAVEAPGALIVRIPVIYGYNGENDKLTFVKSVLAKLRNGERVLANDWQRRYPTLADDAAAAIAHLIGSRATGIYHVAAQQPVTKYEWAREIAAVFGLPDGLVQATTRQRPPAARPLDARLRVQKLHARGAPTPRELRDGLRELRRQMQGAWRRLEAVQNESAVQD